MRYVLLSSFYRLRNLLRLTVLGRNRAGGSKLGLWTPQTLCVRRCVKDKWVKWTSHGSYTAGMKRKQVRKKAQGSSKAGEIKMIYLWPRIQKS